jgi:hypothetical protein
MDSKQKHIIFWLIILVVILIGYKQYNSEKPIGGDRDEYGCLPAAGYQWCASTEKCQRMWEEYCEEYKEQFREEAEINDFESCANAGYPVMESYPMQCMANDVTYVEVIPGEPERTYCLPDQRNADYCIAEYLPVCGFDSEGKQIKTYSNMCNACKNPEVAYFQEGEC